MITYIDSKNASKYTALFKEAENALIAFWRGQGLTDSQIASDDYFGAKIRDEETGEEFYSNGISSLNSYFSWINDLLSITSLPVLDAAGNPSGDEYDFDGMRFSMLPVDEEVFEIDANTRKIAVPKAFVDNGISVQGDEISEVVYFKIPRFYDATDLFNQNVMIEWIAPSGLKGYSVPTVKVLDDTTNYVIFGWALASDITKVNGDVTFSVRFYKYDEDNNKIQYSLSTLTQKAKIQPNIGLDIAGLLGSDGALDGYKVLGDEIKALIKERSENSNFGVAGDKAEIPVIYSIIVKDGKDDEDAAVVVLPEAFDKGWLAHVVGRGYSNDAGSISYFWKKFDYDTGVRLQTGTDDKLVYNDTYTEISMADAEKLATAVPAMQFWMASDDRLQAQAGPYSLDQFKAQYPDAEKVYCKDTVCEFDGVGYYKLVVKNRKGRATEVFESEPMIVYPPNVPVNLGITPHVFLDVPGEDVITATCDIPATPDKDPAYAKNDPIKVGYRDAAGAIVPKYAFDKKFEEISYDWKFIPLGQTEVVDLDAAAQTHTPEAEGMYYCVLAGHLNGSVSDDVATEKCRVTYKPARPTFTLEGTSFVNGNPAAIRNDAALPEVTEEDLKGQDAGEYSIFVGRDMPLKLSYNYNSMCLPADHQLTDEITLQWYCYELQRDEEGRTKGAVDVVDAYNAKRGYYEPTTKNSVLYPADVAIGEPITIKVDDLKATGENVHINQIVPEKDGYYFCIITNKYNDKEDKISTPLAYYDNQNDD